VLWTLNTISSVVVLSNWVPSACLDIVPSLRAKKAWSSRLATNLKWEHVKKHIVFYNTYTYSFLNLDLYTCILCYPVAFSKMEISTSMACTRLVTIPLGRQGREGRYSSTVSRKRRCWQQGGSRQFTCERLSEQRNSAVLILQETDFFYNKRWRLIAPGDIEFTRCSKPCAIQIYKRSSSTQVAIKFTNTVLVRKFQNLHRHFGRENGLLLGNNWLGLSHTMQ
jgi:hypothetical protein